MKNTRDFDSPGLATRCIHAGELANDAGAPHTPLYNTTTFAFPSTADLLEVVDGRRPGSLYTRYGSNPTIQSVETKLAAIEGAEAALLFASGMAAECALFIAHGQDGIVCLGDAYGGTLNLLAQSLPKLGRATTFLSGTDFSELEARLAAGARLVFFETPSNPNLEVLDIGAIAAIAHAHGALVAVDSTFASPVNQQPLRHNADFVVHSATKYLGGHSDLTAGAVMGSRALLTPLHAWRSDLGQTPAPETCALLARSLRTLVVRIERHNANAQTLAEHLESHPRVRHVRYPGLTRHPSHAIARRQMTGFGGMIALEIDGDYADTVRVMDRLVLFARAPSLGGVESLATQPVTTTHRGLDEAERTRRRITDSSIRLSVGLEDAADLMADLDQALA